MAGFSSVGPVTRDGSSRLKPDLAAPGVGILSTYVNSDTNTLSGTSMAAPHVAGVAALLLARNPSLTVAQVESLLSANADDLGAPGWDPYFGAGRVYALRAVAAKVRARYTRLGYAETDLWMSKAL